MGNGQPTWVEPPAETSTSAGQSSTSVEPPAETSTSATQTTTYQCSDSDEEYTVKTASSAIRNVTDFPRMGLELVRGEVSSRLGAALGNALILDLHNAGLLKPDLDLNEILLCKSKLDRQKNNVEDMSASRQKQEPANFHLQCVGFDGRSDDNTLVINARGRHDSVKEHHLTFTKETEKDCGTYLTHMTLPLVGSTGQVMATEIAHVLGEYESRDSIKAMLCDNTSTNTGHKTGAVTSLEVILGKKLHTIGCSLHHNELPLRSVFKSIDGSTKAPDKFSGPIGKKLSEDIHLLPQIDFDPIPSPITEMTFKEELMKDLSRDQRLLLEYTKGIASGSVDAKYVSWKIGPLAHSRWLTLAIRIMCLYTRGTCPPESAENLKKLVTFIVQVYSCSWFCIKRTNSFHLQPEIIFEMVKEIVKQPAAIKKLATTNLQHNSFGLLPENFIYAMCMSDSVATREEAFRVILSCRDRAPLARSKVIPTINPDATTWTELVDISKLKDYDCEPALTESFSNDDIKAAILNGTPLNLPSFPAHSQSVERAVKLTTEASQKVYGFEARHKQILTKIFSRKSRPAFSSKGRYSLRF